MDSHGNKPLLIQRLKSSQNTGRIQALINQITTQMAKVKEVVCFFARKEEYIETRYVPVLVAIPYYQFILTPHRLAAPFDEDNKRLRWFSSGEASQMSTTTWLTCMMSLGHHLSFDLQVMVYGGFVRDLVGGGFLHDKMDIDVRVGSRTAHARVSTMYQRVVVLRSRSLN